MKWNTKISVHKDGRLYVRGIALTALIAERTFVETLSFILKGAFPAKEEVEMLDAVLIACVEHGVEVPSAFVPRVVASVGNPVNAALAAGILATGEYHGGAIEGAMHLLASTEAPETMVTGSRTRGERLQGFGHKTYTDHDPRAEALIAKAKKTGLSFVYIDRALLIETELEKQTSKKLPLNVDGAIAAILLTMGFDARLGKAFFALGRMPGMMAHILEELINEKPYRRFEESDVDYSGPALK